ncbi:MAG: hypothetical protein ACI8UO_004190 [Verrucomicrobiales bacterium]|jgi:hypothetical protein
MKALVFFLAFLSAAASGFGQTITVTPPVAIPETPQWGNLEVYPVFIQAPEHLVQQRGAPTRQTDWFFSDIGALELERILLGAGLTNLQIQRLSNEGRVIGEDEDTRVFPPADIVAALTSEGRARLYRQLSRWDENYYQANPIVIEDGSVYEWFEGTGLRQQLLDVIAAHAYRNSGGVLMFSDVPQVLALIEDSDEEMRFLKALTRTRSLMIRMRITPESDFQALANYWSAAGRSRDVLPMIEAVARTPGVARLDLAHLLPPTPRRYLNSYPSERDGLMGRSPDDFWTAINFFKFTPTDLYHDSLDSREYFNKHFQPKQGAYEFGDIILLARATDNQAVHACVYLADGIVYTKTGAKRLDPWVFSRLPTVIARQGGPTQIVHSAWRKRPTLPRSS